MLVVVLWLLLHVVFVVIVVLLAVVVVVGLLVTLVSLGADAMAVLGRVNPDTSPTRLSKLRVGRVIVTPMHTCEAATGSTPVDSSEEGGVGHLACHCYASTRGTEAETKVACTETPTPAFDLHLFQR